MRQKGGIVTPRNPCMELVNPVNSSDGQMHDAEPTPLSTGFDFMSEAFGSRSDGVALLEYVDSSSDQAAPEPPQSASGARKESETVGSGPGQAADGSKYARPPLRKLRGHIDKATRAEVIGWTWDPERPADRIRLELTDGQSVLVTAVADVHRPGLVNAGIGDGRHEFRISLPADLLSVEGRVFHLRCADTASAVPGSPIVLEAEDATKPPVPTGTKSLPAVEFGYCDELTSSFVEGWAVDPSDTEVPLTMKVFIDDTYVSTVKCDRPRYTADGRAARPVGFYVTVPPALHDGFDHVIEFRGNDGRPIVLRDKFGIHLKWTLPAVSPLGLDGSTDSSIPDWLSKSPLFDENWYVTSLGSLSLPRALTSKDIFQHWVRYGLPNRIVPTPLFDEEFYLSSNPDLIALGTFGFHHFISIGLKSGLSPNAWFDSSWYLSSAPDAAGWCPPLTHFVHRGVFDGCSPNRLLRPARLRGATIGNWCTHGRSLMEAYGRVAKSIGDGAASFLLALYHYDYYRVNASLEEGTNCLEALEHFLSSGFRKNLSPSPLFEPDFYAREWLRVSGTEIPKQLSYIEHWLITGRQKIPVPTRLFSDAYYREQWPDMVDPAIDVFDHFVRFGVHENRRATPWFDPAWYQSGSLGGQQGVDTAYLSFLTSGAPAAEASRVLWLLSGGIDRRRPILATDRSSLEEFAQLAEVTSVLHAKLSSNEIEFAAFLFFPELYLAHASVLSAGSSIQKLSHFLRHDLESGEQVGPLFSANVYRLLATERGVKLEDLGEPFLHFLKYGVAQRIVPTDLFDEQMYRGNYPDIDPTYWWVFEHFVKHGLYEMRVFCTRPMIEIVQDPSLSSVAFARRRLIVATTDNSIIADGTRSTDIFRILSAQRQATELLNSDQFRLVITRAQQSEPLIGECTDPRDLLYPPFHDGFWSKFKIIKGRLRRPHYAHIICVPWLRAGGADLVAGFLSNALRDIFPSQPILFLLTDQPHFERRDWLPAEIDVLDISDIVQVSPAQEAERLLFTLIRGLRPACVYNVNSRLCWQTFKRFGSRVPPEVRLFAYLFCWDQTKSGRRVGYPSEFFPDSQGCLTALITDTTYLKQELIRLYALPPEVAGRICPLASPSRATSDGATQAEIGVSTAVDRPRPLFLWGGRLDFQKRFDLLIQISLAMPGCDFRCWGVAMLDQQPDLAHLPSNVTMMGSFKYIEELPLGESDGWVFTSAWEGLPTTIIELGSLGMPIVASAVGGIPELIDASTGWLVDPFDSIDRFVGCLQELIDNPAERISRAVRLRERVRSRHTMTAYKRELLRLLGLET